MNDATEPEISIYELWQIVRRGLPVIGITVVIGAVVGIVAGFTIPDAYRAKVVFADVGGDGAPLMTGESGLLGQLGLGGLTFAPTQGMSGQGNINPGTLMRSRTFAERFIQDNDLLPDLFPRDWDPEAGAWKSGSAPRLWIAAIEFNERFEVQQSQDVPGASELTVDWVDAEGAAAVANGLIEAINEVARQRDIQNAQRSIDYLNEQMAETDVVELQRALFNLMEAEQKTLMMANARDHYTYEVIDPALVPPYPFRPNKPQLLIAGIVGGGGLGLAIVFVLALRRNWREPGQ